MVRISTELCKTLQCYQYDCLVYTVLDRVIIIVDIEVTNININFRRRGAQNWACMLLFLGEEGA